MKTDEKIYDLNISEKYVPSWGAWEVGREIVSNAIDSDPDGYQVERVDPMTIHVWTETCPSLNQIRVLGMGTKDGESETIGQFGEGFKLAALVACRNEGGITVVTPDFVARYFLEPLEGESISVLKCSVTAPENKTFKGCSVWVRMPGINQAIEGRFLRHRLLGPIEKKDPLKVRFFMKGVYVMELKQKALFDWNIDRCPINRDRTILDSIWVKERIAVWLSQNMDNVLADQIIAAPMDAYEFDVLNIWPERIGDKARTLLRQAIRDFYGVNIVLACSESYANSIAASRGKKVIILAPALMGLVGSKGLDDGIKMANDELAQSMDMISASSVGNECVEEISELRKIIDVLGIPAELHIFKSRDGANEAGRAVYDKDRKVCRVWMNESLFIPGRRLERLSTLCHELGHIQGGTDLTEEFESSLDNIAGKLAMALMDERSARRIS